MNPLHPIATRARTLDDPPKESAPRAGAQVAEPAESRPPTPGPSPEGPAHTGQGPARRARPGPPPGADRHLVSLLEPLSFEAEHYRALRHAIERLHRESGLSVVAVSSAAAGDGKTTTAINLAGALAQSPEARVLLVDADLRLSAVAHHLGLEGSPGPGLAEAIQNPGIELRAVTRRLDFANLSLLLAGRCQSSPYEVLKAPRLGELIAEARRQFEYVVVDTPPQIPVPDGRIIERWVDGFLLVVAAHRTPRKLLEEALYVMEPAKVLGLVFNGDDRPLSGYYGYYYTYGHPPGEGRGGQKRGKMGGDPSPEGGTGSSRPAMRMVRSLWQ